MNEQLSNEIRARFHNYPPRNNEEIQIHEGIRQICRTAALALVTLLPESVTKTREFSQTLTDLENAMMHTNAAYARHKPYGLQETEPRTAAGSLD